MTDRTVEVFHRGQRVAAHDRRYGGARHVTDAAHMPSAHRRYAERTPARFERWGREIGPETEGFVIAILHGRPPSRAGLPHLPGRAAPVSRPRPGQIRTVQRRLKGWRSDAAHKLVFGDGELATAIVPIEEQVTSPARTVS